jgi:hypothetical protein
MRGKCNSHLPHFFLSAIGLQEGVTRMARAVKYPEVVAVRLSPEGKTKLSQLAVLLDKPQAEVLRLLVKWAKFVDVSPLRFDRGESEHAEMCEV